ncbi:hypothetical protein ACFLSJ_01450 [Verrucomicrobiota bacterium]
MKISQCSLGIAGLLVVFALVQPEAIGQMCFAFFVALATVVPLIAGPRNYRIGGTLALLGAIALLSLTVYRVHQYGEALQKMRHLRQQRESKEAANHELENIGTNAPNPQL